MAPYVLTPCGLCSLLNHQLRLPSQPVSPTHNITITAPPSAHPLCTAAADTLCFCSCCLRLRAVVAAAFVPAAHMFDKTSVVMLCMMTIAFLIPCVLSYVPALRMLQGPGFNSLGPTGPRHSSGYDARGPVSGGAAAAAGAWPAYSTGGSYTGAIPPRPAARVRPGANPVS